MRELTEEETIRLREAMEELAERTSTILSSNGTRYVSGEMAEYLGRYQYSIKSKAEHITSEDSMLRYAIASLEAIGPLVSSHWFIIDEPFIVFDCDFYERMKNTEAMATVEELSECVFNQREAGFGKYDAHTSTIPFLKDVPQVVVDRAYLDEIAGNVDIRNFERMLIGIGYHSNSHGHQRITKHLFDDKVFVDDKIPEVLDIWDFESDIAKTRHITFPNQAPSPCVREAGEKMLNLARAVLECLPYSNWVTFAPTDSYEQAVNKLHEIADVSGLAEAYVRIRSERNAK